MGIIVNNHLTWCDYFIAIAGRNFPRLRTPRKSQYLNVIFYQYYYMDMKFSVVIFRALENYMYLLTPQSDMPLA